MHKLLARQLKRYLEGRLESTPKVLHEFIQAVNTAYEQADTDRHLLEHSLEVTSQEMQERYAKVLMEIEQRRVTEELLRAKNQELAAINDMMLGREERVLELKSEINQLLLQLGQEARYRI